MTEACAVNEDDDPEMRTMPDGTREWWRDGKRHRDGGPAIEWFDGTKVWFQHGKLHREDGPAYEGRESKDNQYHLFDEELAYPDFVRRIAELQRQRHEQSVAEKSALMAAIEKDIALQAPVTVRRPLQLKKNGLGLN
ncbi:MAG: hypothetical protein ACAH83_10540 [Alphaproteobacteria bacterium]